MNLNSHMSTLKASIARRKEILQQIKSLLTEFEEELENDGSTMRAMSENIHNRNLGVALSQANRSRDTLINKAWAFEKHLTDLETESEVLNSDEFFLEDTIYREDHLN